MNPYDICQCGDYRRDHEGGTGPCTFPPDQVHGFRRCERFRLSMASGADGNIDNQSTAPADNDAHAPGKSVGGEIE